MIEPSTPIVRIEGVLEAEVDGEVVALDVEQGQCYGFNSVATAIWHRLAKETSVEAICEDLLGEFEIDRAQCHEDVLRSVRELSEAGLIRVVG